MTKPGNERKEGRMPICDTSFRAMKEETLAHVNFSYRIRRMPVVCRMLWAFPFWVMMMRLYTDEMA